MARAVRHLDATEVLTFLGRGLSPYFLLLAPWAEGNPPEWLVRLPSALAAAGVACLAWKIGRDRDIPGLAWRCGAAVAMSPFLAWHAREARWYTLAWLLGALSLRHTLRAVGRGGRRDTVLAASWGLLAAIVYSPAAVTLMVALGAIAITGAKRRLPPPAPRVAIQEQRGTGDRPGRRSSTWTRNLARLAAALLAFAGLSWGWLALIRPAFSEGADGFGFSNTGAFSVAAVAYTPVAFATGYTIGPGPAEWHDRSRRWPSAVEGAALGAGVACLAFLMTSGVRRLRERGAGMEAAALAALVLIPTLAVLIAAAWTGHRYAPRHAGMAFVPTVLLAAAGTLVPARSRRIPVVAPTAALLLLLLQITALVHLHRSPRYLREQVGAAARYVASVATTDDLVLVLGGIDLPWNRYDRGTAPSRIVYPDDTRTWAPAPLRDLVEAHARVIVVRGLIMDVAGEEPVLETLAGLTRLLNTAAFPGVEVEVRGVVPAGSAR